MRFAAYALGSSVLTAAIVSNAFVSKSQFYPSVIYLTTSKTCILVLGNMAFVVVLLFGQLIKKMFLGTLRTTEIERVYEQLWYSIMETCLAMTIFRREEFNSIKFVALFTILMCIKIFSWLTQDRVSYIEQSPLMSLWSHIRLLILLTIIFILDLIFTYVSIMSTITYGPSMMLLFAFEFSVVGINIISTFFKYSILYKEMRYPNWENKGIYLFYLEFVTDLLSLLVNITFFSVILLYFGLPLHMMRDLYVTFRSFRRRIIEFIRYRKATSNMNERYPDATAEELAATDRMCIVCREEMAAAKKLPCNHLFHFHCLRSWLERQQTCPTCRASVLIEEHPNPNANTQNNVNHVPPAFPNWPPPAAPWPPMIWNNGLPLPNGGAPLPNGGIAFPNPMVPPIVGVQIPNGGVQLQQHLHGPVASGGVNTSTHVPPFMFMPPPFIDPVQQIMILQQHIFAIQQQLQALQNTLGTNVNNNNNYNNNNNNGSANTTTTTTTSVSGENSNGTTTNNTGVAHNPETAQNNDSGIHKRHNTSQTED